MTDPITRRQFTAAAAVTLGGAMSADAQQPKQPAAAPTEAPFERDYPAPGFKPKWARPQLNRQMVQDFVIYAHSDIGMTKKLLEKEPALVNAFMDWGAGDWESGLGGAAHMGRRDICEFLLEKGARIDIFAAAMLGHLDAVKALISAHPALIDAKGPHGFTLHFHAQVGDVKAQPVLDYLQSIKKIEMKPNPFKK